MGWGLAPPRCALHGGRTNRFGGVEYIPMNLLVCPVAILFALDEYDGMKILRQGAMIMNNGGHLMVDEYDKMPKQEQKKLNIAMEQQRAKYNKGGHTGDAECKTTVIASCNPSAER